MNVDRSQEQQHLPKQMKTPAWFAGKELDVLDAGERDQLYQDVLATNPPQRPWFLIVVGALNVPNVIHGFQTGTHRILWVILPVVLLLAVLSAWFYRRVSIRRDGRRAVRELADWPLRDPSQDLPRTAP